MSNTQTVPVADLHDTLRRVYAATSLPEAQARVLIDTLLDAEFRGVRTHGLSRVKLYRDKVAAGSVEVSGRITRLSERPAVARLDGHDGLGQWLAQQAMQEAIDKAGRLGIGAVAVRNSQHFGTAGYYAEMAARQGMIGMAFTNASPRLAAWGSSTSLLGNNPWSIGAPTDVVDVPFVLDISNSVTSAGRIRQAQRKGESIPLSWAVDAQGNPTTDPVAALAGTLLPFGEHKGYGITMAVSLLTSVLADGAPDSEVRTMDDPQVRQQVSHTFVALNIEFFQPLDGFKARMHELIAHVHASQPLPSTRRLFYPGERGYLQKRDVLQAGEVDVDAAVWRGILDLLG